ncbi:MAG: hypothetical protein ACOCRX_04095 [Candidatus Woesearchaeota archaeon]
MEKVIATIMIIFSFVLIFSSLFFVENLAREYDLFNNDLFGYSFGLIGALIGTFITISVFLVQNTSQDYSSRLIKDVFFLKDWNFSLIMFYSFICLIFFAIGLTFDLRKNWSFIGFSFIIGLVFNFISLIILSIYYMNIPNLIKEKEKSIIRLIEPSKLKKVLSKVPFLKTKIKHDIPINKVIKNTNTIFNTTHRSIELRDYDSFEQSLVSIKKIVQNYTNHSSLLRFEERFSYNQDIFLREIKTEIKLLVTLVSKKKNEKIKIMFCESLANIASIIIQYGLSNGSIFGSVSREYQEFLLEFFKNSDLEKNSILKKKVISENSKIISTYLEHGGCPKYVYSPFIDEIVDLINQIKNKRLKTDLMSLLINLIFNAMKVLLKDILNGDKTYESYLGDLKSDLKQIYNVSDILPYENKSRIYAELLGKDVFSFLKKSYLSDRKYNRYHDALKNYLDYFEKITRKNDFNVAYYIKDFIKITYFMEIIKEDDFKFEKFHHKMLNSILIKLKVQIIPDSDVFTSSHIDVFYHIGNYFSILVFSKNKELFKEQLNLFLDHYKEIQSEEKLDQKKKQMFVELLKIIGSFIYDEEEFDSSEKEIIKKLRPNTEFDYNTDKFKFYQNYPYLNFEYPKINDFWKFTDFGLFNKEEQNEISSYFNRDNYYKFTEFNKKLKEKFRNNS